MIHHVSLPARNPRLAAEVLARMLGGEAMPFPVIAGAWVAWSGDGVTELEIIPHDQAYTRNADVGKEPTMVATGNASAPCGWHLAISTEIRASEVVRIAREAGWPADICDRAGFFSLIEVWLDGTTLIEVLDPEMLAQYRSTFDAQKWRAMLRSIPLTGSGGAIEQIRAAHGSF